MTQLVKGLAHITGGGITENLPRILPQGTAALVDKSAWTPNAVFRYLQRAGGVPEDDMYRTFTMGIGMIVGCAPDDADRVTRMLQAADDTEDSLSARILAEEHRIYPEAIQRILDGGWRVVGRRLVPAEPGGPARP